MFGMPLEALTLERVQGFLEEAEPEPLLWEAKGTELKPHEIRRQCGGFANSEQGGYLILGASEGGSGWCCDGLVFPGGEPYRYVTSCLQEGVRPLPRYDVKSFRTQSDRDLAVVEIEPLEAGPAIVRGTVYERVPGATVPVKDPSRLADLFGRGRRAHERAIASAERMLSIAAAPLAGCEQDSRFEEVGCLIGVLAIGAIAPGPDMASRPEPGRESPSSY